MVNVGEYFRYLKRIRRTRPTRYANLFKLIFKHKCRRILEIGVYDGIHAIQMIQTAIIHYPAEQIEYTGFDLFELLTEEKFEEEYAKHPPSFTEVQNSLKKTGANITLYQGDTKIMLPNVKDSLGFFDFIFIDGGHSIETISSDWNSVKDLMGDKTIVVFDDYLTNLPPEMEGIGCQSIVDSFDRNIYEVKILKPKNKFNKDWGILETSFVKVVKK